MPVEAIGWGCAMDPPEAHPANGDAGAHIHAAALLAECQPGEPACADIGAVGLLRERAEEGVSDIRPAGDRPQPQRGAHCEVVHGGAGGGHRVRLQTAFHLKNTDPAGGRTGPVRLRHPQRPREGGHLWPLPQGQQRKSAPRKAGGAGAGERQAPGSAQGNGRSPRGSRQEAEYLAGDAGQRAARKRKAQ